MRKSKATILLFHRVHPVRDIMWDPMDPGRFQYILKFIKKNYTVLPLLEILHGPVHSKKPLAAITFDDGYKDFIEYSLPIMDALKIPSSMYVVTDCISKDKPTWTFEVDYLFFHTRKLKIKWTLDTGFLPTEYRKDTFANKKELLSFCRGFKQYIKKIPEEKRKVVIENLFHSFNDVAIPRGLMMSWQEVNQLLTAGIEVGSHTVTHPPLATLNKTGLDDELQLSKSEYFKYTGKDPLVISYPVGSYNEEVKKASAHAGYAYGLAVDNKIYDRHAGDRFAIPRIELYNEPFWKCWIRIKQYV